MSTVHPTKVCAFDGCGRSFHANGYCTAHNVQFTKGQTLRPIEKRTPQGHHHVCRYCDRPATIHRVHRHACFIHCRIDPMQTCARSRGLYTPTAEELVSLFNDLITKGMKCGHCQSVMVWNGRAANVVTLQHDRNGTIRLLCLSCNSRHYTYPGDEFYNYPLNWAFCPMCKTAKHESNFYRKRNGRRSSYCKSCKHLIAKREYAAIKERTR